MVILHADEPVWNVDGMERNDAGQDQPCAGRKLSPDDEPSRKRERQWKDSERPLPARGQTYRRVSGGQRGSQVFGPLVIVSDHARPQMALAARDVVEAIDMTRRVQVEIHAVGSRPAASGDGAIVDEQPCARGQQWEAEGGEGEEALAA